MLGSSYSPLLIAAALLALAQDASAEPAVIDCEMPENLRERIDACSANTRAVASARQCYQRIVHAWQEAPVELNRIMSIAKNRTNSRQQAELAFSKGDYEKTIAKLRKLLAETEENTRRVADYPLAMLQDPDFPELNCYMDPYEEVQEIVYQLDDRIAEGERTLAIAEGLRGTSEVRERYVGTDSINRHAGASEPGLGSKRHEKVASDVTGLKEELEKQRVTEETLRVLDQRAKAEFRQWEKMRRPGNGRSSVSEAIEVFSRSGPVNNDFEAEISKTSGSGGVNLSTNEAAQREALSVGALLFEEGGRTSSVKLELKAEITSSAAASRVTNMVANTEADQEAARAGRALASVSSSSAVESLGFSTEDRVEKSSPLLQQSPAPSSHDGTLFSMVSDRYRRTELFRRARVSDVPLVSFENELAR
jgi:hypothetical protein